MIPIEHPEIETYDDLFEVLGKMLPSQRKQKIKMQYIGHCVSVNDTNVFIRLEAKTFRNENTEIYMVTYSGDADEEEEHKDTDA